MNAGQSARHTMDETAIEKFAETLARRIIEGLPVQQARNESPPPPTKLQPGNRLTLSLFSELRYGLGTTQVGGAAPTQELISTLDEDDTGSFGLVYDDAVLKGFGAQAYTLVYSAGKTDTKDLPAAAVGKVRIPVPSGSTNPDPRTLVAILLSAGKEVLVVSFVSRTQKATVLANTLM